MNETTSPKTFRAPDSPSNKLWIVIALQSCVILALVAYIFMKPDNESRLAIAQPTPSEPRRTVPPAEPSKVEKEILPPPAAPTLDPAAPKTLAPGENPNARLSFRFNYMDTPEKWREWRRVTPKQWEEVEHDGRVTHFTVVSRIDEAAMAGTIVRRNSDLKMDVLIPDKTSTRRMYWRIPPDGKWVYMGQVSAEATLPAKNEEF